MLRRGLGAWSVSIRVQTDEDSSAMPQILKTLDEIAWEKQRDVLCVMFFDPGKPPKQLSVSFKSVISNLH